MDNSSYERLGFYLQSHLKNLGYSVRHEHAYWWLYKDNELVLDYSDPFVSTDELALWLVAAGIEIKGGKDV